MAKRAVGSARGNAADHPVTPPGEAGKAIERFILGLRLRQHAPAEGHDRVGGEHEGIGMAGSDGRELGLGQAQCQLGRQLAFERRLV